MQKLIILLGFFICWTAAGHRDRAFNPWWSQGLHPQQSNAAYVTQHYTETSQRQKFLLDVLLQVQRPVTQPELIGLGSTLIDQPDLYLDEHDELLREFLYDAGEQQILERTGVFNYLNIAHCRQLLGLYKFFLLARDWSTFQRNVAYARLHFNPIMFVNALLKAVRDREDAQDLVVPAMSEILPQLFFDEKVVVAAYNIDWSKLTTTMSTTAQPSFFDILGIGSWRAIPTIGHRARLAKESLWRPWKEWRMSHIGSRSRDPVNFGLGMPVKIDDRHNAVHNDGVTDLGDKIIVPVNGENEISYLTDDIALNEFWNNVITERLVQTTTERRRHIFEDTTTGQVIKSRDYPSFGSSSSAYTSYTPYINTNTRDSYQQQRQLPDWDVSQSSKDVKWGQVNDDEYKSPVYTTRRNSVTLQKDRIIDGDRLMGLRTNNVDYDDIVLSSIRTPHRNTNRNEALSTTEWTLSERSGEVFIQTMQQLIARINLEKIALQTEYGRIQKTSRKFSPRLVTTNGMAYQQRTLTEKKAQNIIKGAVQQLKTIIDDRLQRDQIDHRSDEVLQVIGDILMNLNSEEGNIWDKIFTDIVRNVYDVTDGSNKDVKTTLLSIATGNLREPIYLDIVEELVNLIDEYKQNLQPYTVRELSTKDIIVNDIDVDRLLTYVELYDTDLINLVDQQLLQSNINNILKLQKKLVARQKRLNHNPFSITYDVTSERNQDVVVRTFLGPRTDQNGRELNLTENRRNFILLDAFAKNLKIGTNIFERKSRDITGTTRDVTTLGEIYRHLITGKSTDELVSASGLFPQRLLLPRGTTDGLLVQIFVVVTPVGEDERVIHQVINPKQITGLGIPSIVLDRLPLGFPLDRNVDIPNNVQGELSNILLKDCIIQHSQQLRVHDL